MASSQRSLELARRHPYLWTAAGIHPNDVLHHNDADWLMVSALASHPKCVAIGETGLDYYWRDVPPDIQKRWFIRHIELSVALEKPLVIHARNSVGDTLQLIEPYFSQGLKAVWHCFTAGKKEIGGALDFAVKHGLFLAVGGLATYEDQKSLRQHVKLIPDHLLLLETDAPYIIPAPKRTTRNDPRGVIRVAEVLAELRETTPETIADTTRENAHALLRLHDTRNIDA